MNFRSISIVKLPVDSTWEMMFSRLPQIASEVDEIESVTEIERIKMANSVTKVVNVWKAKPKLPEFISRHLKPEMFEWTDTATWYESEKRIDWTITSHFLKGMENNGTTLFETAMGGKGCRITFAGVLNLSQGGGLPNFGFLNGAVLKTAETIMVQMIPSYFRKLTDVLPRAAKKSK